MLFRSPYIDEIYSIGMKAGALGGKLLGAGGGGYMLFYVPLASRTCVINAIGAVSEEYKEFPFKFDTQGSTVTII